MKNKILPWKMAENNPLDRGEFKDAPFLEERKALTNWCFLLIIHQKFSFVFLRK